MRVHSGCERKLRREARCRSIDQYAPPSAELETPVPDPPFYSTSTPRFALLSVLTLGLFNILWLYRNWRGIRDLTGQRILPIARAFFGPLFVFSLYSFLDKKASRYDLPRPSSPGTLALAYLLLSAATGLPDPYWLVSLLAFLALIPANTLTSHLNRALEPEAQAIAPWSLWSIVAAALGAFLLALAVVGAFLPELE